MTHEFEVREEIELAATPERVWDAIATGPGIDSWFMGKTEIEPGEGGRGSFTMFGQTTHSTVTAWDPGKHFAYRSDADDEGKFMAFEYLIEAREGGSTVLRFVHSGMLGDDWESEYDALKVGDRMYLEKLAIYVTHFPGTASSFNLFAPGPQTADSDRAWAAIHAALGVSDSPAEGDPVRVAIEGIEPADGVVAFTKGDFVAVRTGQGLYMFMYGFMNTPVVEYHHYVGDVDEKAVETAWQSWLAKSFA